jgi:hypothetical protein
MEKINFNDYFLYKDGYLFWKNTKHGRSTTKPISNIDKSGYSRVRCNNNVYYCHRIIYEMHYGEILKNLQVDHIDRNKSNNKIENLRLATKKENSRNKSSKGFTWSKSSKKWVAQIRVDGTYHYLGLYKTEIDAHAAYLQARKQFFGLFA